MTDGSERYGTYDPFEDTGDWPFRDAPPREDDPRKSRFSTVPPVEEPVSARLTIEDEIAASPRRVPSTQTQPRSRCSRSLPPRLAAEDRGCRGGAEHEAVRRWRSPTSLSPTSHRRRAVVAEVVVDEDVVAVVVEADAEDAVDELEVASEHAPGDLIVPSGVDVLTGAPHGFRRSVAVVVSRFNGDVTTQLLEHALDALARGARCR